MEGAFERADRRAHRGVHVTESRCDYAARECGGIEPMLGVQNVSDIQRLNGVCAWLFPRYQPQEVSGFTQVFADGWQRLSATCAVKPRRDDADLRYELDRDRVILGHRQIVSAGLVAAEHRHCRTHDVDRG